MEITPNKQQWKVCIRCLLCENTRELEDCESERIQLWVCDECKQAIQWAKERMYGAAGQI